MSLFRTNTNGVVRSPRSSNNNNDKNSVGRKRQLGATPPVSSKPASSYHSFLFRWSKPMLLIVVSSVWAVWIFSYQPEIYASPHSQQQQYLWKEDSTQKKFHLNPPKRNNNIYGRDTKSTASAATISMAIPPHHKTKNQQEQPKRQAEQEQPTQKNQGVRSTAASIAHANALAHQVNSTTTPKFRNHKFLFVHVGKAGGTTIQNNIRIICTRKNIENNLGVHKSYQQNPEKFRTKHPSWMLKPKDLQEWGFSEPMPMHQGLSCIRQLDKQRAKQTEMMISKLSPTMVIGFLHMNFLMYWWNANDDGDAEFGPNQSGSSDFRSVQDKISGIIEAGNASNDYNVRNITMFANPPIYSKQNQSETGLHDSTAFLIPARDPVARLISAYKYHHPSSPHQKKSCTLNPQQQQRNKKFHRWAFHSFYCVCFPKLNDLVDFYRTNNGKKNIKRAPSYKSFVLGHESTDDTTETVSCKDIAEWTLRGSRPYKADQNDDSNALATEHAFDTDLVRRVHYQRFYIGHLSINYGFYYRRTVARYPSKDLVVIRTENLWEDLQELEYQMGGTALVKGEETGHESQTYGSHKYEEGAGSLNKNDTEGIQALCCAIVSDAQIYIELLERATNLSPSRKQESLDAFAKRCKIDECLEQRRNQPFVPPPVPNESLIQKIQE